MVPSVEARVTVPPVEVRLFPLASLACTVMVDTEEPLATIVAGLAEITVVLALTGPATIV
jgi:hypothetical protein